jgi:hypothetical protein
MIDLATQCPICLSKWKQEGQYGRFTKCSNATCKAGADKDQNYLYKGFDIPILGYGNLYWMFNFNKCTLYFGSDSKPIGLPLLPFDITADKLKLYLTFL